MKFGFHWPSGFCGEDVEIIFPVRIYEKQAVSRQHSLPGIGVILECQCVLEGQSDLGLHCLLRPVPIPRIITVSGNVMAF